MEWLYLAVGLVIGFIVGKLKTRIVTIPAVSGDDKKRQGGKKPPVLRNGKWVYQAED